MESPAARDDVRLDPRQLPPAELARRRIHFRALDAGSHMDFAAGFKAWMDRRAARPRATVPPAGTSLTASASPTAPAELTDEEAWNLRLRDPLEAARTRLHWSIHDYMWDRALRAFHGDAAYLRAMQATDATGPGTLTLDPELAIPDYARHEVHRQPGGYVGDPFAGWVYHYALTLAHYQKRTRHGELQMELANSVPKPADGRVQRVLEIGCAGGVFTTALKERFARAEVWGIDVGAPMVRYAHHRAATLGLEVHFAQRLAEDTRFPDGHFDVVTDYLLFHEVSADAARRIIAETARILRPGGVWCHNDAQTAGWPEEIHRPDRSLAGKATAWNIYRHNFEPWYEDYKALDFPRLLREAGFDVDLSGPPIFRGRPSVNAVKRDRAGPSSSGGPVHAG
jgi:ubiquinone/menaquinone biosynthesis C-methylase UbiE